ncbi:hypothetical protein H1164_15665 [Thermoactinomyces daqus]|uniref:Uncharacterized protein n=1 Tax=Thermoactinomyces daqus TaxID=1329516 RepID=A0A7W2AJE9_9BACL|nr:hypothetical protein [Thermoactinomyces daqus]MBA4544290.1 hypothetical protein [Thermoactinomyces daqus]
MERFTSSASDDLRSRIRAAIADTLTGVADLLACSSFSPASPPPVCRGSRVDSRFVPGKLPRLGRRLRGNTSVAELKGASAPPLRPAGGVFFRLASHPKKY